MKEPLEMPVEQERKVDSKVEVFQKLRNSIQDNEEKVLHPKAAHSKNHRRPKGAEEDHRLPYKRDVDRIIHSKAYGRYVDKTQVVYLVQNDHITHRGLHVQLVSNFSRGIAEILRLNVDLVEAIALGHDVGHPPFGHEGEEYLSELSLEYGNSAFTHSVQSCRLFSIIEPLNLGEAVYDGFLCHDGGMREYKLYPQFEKSWADHQKELSRRKEEPNCDLKPKTLEGCLVRLCDTISYVGKDIEDAINLEIIQREAVPTTLLGKTNKQILTTIACDIIEQSYNQDYIALSPEVNAALVELRNFNFKNIYSSPKLKGESKKIKRSYRLLFEWLLEDLARNGKTSHIGSHFLPSKSEEYRETTTPVQVTIDYIAGMTDSYFIKILQKIFIPTAIELSST